LPLPGRALAFSGLARCALGDLAGLAEMEKALAAFVAAGNGREAALVHHNLGSVLRAVDGPMAAVAQYERSRAFAASRGITSLVPVSGLEGLGALVAGGRCRDAVDGFGRIEEDAHLAGPGGEAGGVAEMAAALYELGLDASEPAARALELARETDDRQVLVAVAASAAMALAAAGRPADARALLEEASNVRHPGNYEFAFSLPQLARAAASIHAPDLVPRFALGVPELMAGQRHALATVRAIEAEQREDHRQAAALYGEVAAQWEQFTARLEQAYALLGEGRCLAALEAPTAEDVLRRARALFDAIGALPRVADCDSLITQVNELSSTVGN
jgi:hypothetical protein